MGNVVTYTKAKIDALMIQFMTLQLASPAFTGNPTAPTPAPGDNDASIATTAFVATSFAPLASPTFTGDPQAPTPATGDNDTSIATTAFVQATLAASPVLGGDPKAPTAAVGDNDTSIATTAFVQASKLKQVVAQAATAYTLALTDAFAVVESSNAAATVITVPPNSAVAFPIGTIIEIVRAGAGTVTIAAGAGVTINSPGGVLTARVQWSTVRLRKRGTDLWLLSGVTD